MKKPGLLYIFTGRNLHRAGLSLLILCLLVFTLSLLIAPQTALAASPPPPPPPTPRQAGPHIMPYNSPGPHGVNPGVVQPLAAPAGAHLTYYGGPVISNMKVVLVGYGTGTYLSSVSPATALSSFVSQYLGSGVMDWLSEYDTPAAGGTNQHIGRGTYNSTVTITPSSANNGSTIQDAQIISELNAQISAGFLPMPDVNTHYATFFRANQSICQGGSCSLVASGFCAYHSTFTAPNHVVATYTVMPDLAQPAGRGGCGTSTDLGNTTSVLSHELSETITDPQVGFATTTAAPLAWYDSTNGEIGDICNAQQGTFVGSDGITYTVQLQFSNIASDCILTRTVVNNFSISAAPAALSLNPGASGTASISTALVSGSAGTVNLSVSGAPVGVTASLSPTSVTAGGSSTLTVSVGASVAVCTGATLTVTGTEGSVVHSATVALNVAASGGGDLLNGDFETGTLNCWTPTGSTSISGVAHSGAYSALVGATTQTNGDSSISQPFTAPSGAGTLGFYYQVVCPDVVTFDWATATLTDNTAGTTSTLLAKTCTNNGSWVPVSTAITAGHSYTLTLTSHDDNYVGDPTYTLYDDVAIGAPAAVLTSITLAPASASVAAGGTQQFSAAALDQFGQPISQLPTFSWTVSGGGAINTSGLFTAGTTPGGPFTVTATSGSVSGTASVSVVPNDFSISASPNALSLNQGASGTATISTALVSGSAGTVSLAVSGAPAGVTAGLTPASVATGGSSTLNIAVDPTTAAGPYTLTVTGTEGTTSHSTTVALTVVANANDFTVSATPTALSLNQGASGTATINTGLVTGSVGTVSLAVSGAPAGVTASLNPASVATGGSSTLNIAVGPTAAAGPYTLTVTGTDGLASHSATVSLTVAANDFSISASPASLSITAGSSGSVTLSTSAINGVGSISLSAAGQPAGVTATFSPASINAGSSTTLTLATSAFAVAGSYTVTVTGTEGSISHTAVIALTVKSAFPQASILDTFNRANGRVGTSWTGLTDSSFYRINGNRLDVQIGGPLVWQPTLFGANQEAFITLSTIDPASASQGLLLKVQGSSIPNGGAIVVVYDATAKAVRVKTLRLNTQTWTVYTGQAATFANGDQLGARALANGTVLIYKNGNLIAIVTLSTADQTFFNSKGGRIGLWTVNAPNAFFDNFGGGSVTLP